MPRGVSGYLHQVAIAVDQLVNALVGGWADETLSARAWRLRHRPAWARIRRVIDALFFWESAHCASAWAYEAHRGHLPPAYRDGAGFHGANF